MIGDVDRSLAGWLGGFLPPHTPIRFDQPDPAWLAPPPEKSFVGAWLRDIRRDDRGRGSGWTEVRDAQGRVVGRQPGVQRYQLSYVVTAWAGDDGRDDDGAGRLPGSRVLAEHELLGSVLKACSTADSLPAECLSGDLAEAGIPVAVHCAPEGLGAATDHLWAGWNIAPRAYLDLVLVAPLVPPMDTDQAPLTKEIVVDLDHHDPKRPSPSRSW